MRSIATNKQKASIQYVNSRERVGLDAVWVGVGQ